MKKRFFKKEILSNRLQYADGTTVPFEAAAENRGIIVLDESKTEDAKRIVELKSISGTRGVSEIDEAAYNDVKKKQASTKVSGLSKGPRLHEIKTNPFGSQLPPGVSLAPGAAVPASAAPAAGAPNADTAAAPAASDKKPVAPGFKAPVKRAPRSSPKKGAGAK